MCSLSAVDNVSGVNSLFKEMHKLAKPVLEDTNLYNYNYIHVYISPAPTFVLRIKIHILSEMYIRIRLATRYYVHVRVMLHVYTTIIMSENLCHGFNNGVTWHFEIVIIIEMAEPLVFNIQVNCTYMHRKYIYLNSVYIIIFGSMVNCLDRLTLFLLLLSAAAGQPTDVHVVELSSTSVEMQWDPPVVATGYFIYYSASGVSVDSVEVTGRDTDVQQIDDLQSNSVYMFTIVALSQHLPSEVAGPFSLSSESACIILYICRV